MAELTAARWMIIVNPAAANGKVAERWPAIEQRLRRRLPNFSTARTQYPGHAVQLAREAIQAGFRHLIAVGGDGTNHEVTNGILQQQTVPSRQVVYTLLPVGTGNDWIRTHGIPRQIDRWLDMLDAGHLTRQDAGLVRYWSEGKQRSAYFVNVAGMAYDAFVVRYGAEHRSWVRNRFFYLLLILRCLFQYRLTSAAITADGTTLSQRFYTINVGICRYSGGGMQLVPQARPNDGLLALTYAGPVSKLGVIFNTWRFYNGSIGRHPKIQTGQARHIRVDAAAAGQPPLPLEADGEFLGFSPAEFSILEDALTIVAPNPE